MLVARSEELLRAADKNRKLHFSHLRRSAIASNAAVMIKGIRFIEHILINLCFDSFQ